MQMHILIIEDNILITDGLKYFLEGENYQVSIAHQGKIGFDLIKQNKIDLIILDISLPDIDGFTLCEQIKKEYNIPIIFLTARDLEDDIVRGLTLADDYLIKPFRNRELLMRIRKLIDNNQKNKMLQVKEYKVDLSKCEVIKNNTIINLTALEYKIFVVLLLNINRVVTLEYLLDFIYQETGNYVNDNTLRVYIKRIREKINDDNLIKTIKGLGYRVDDNEING